MTNAPERRDGAPKLTTCESGTPSCQASAVRTSTSLVARRPQRSSRSRPPAARTTARRRSCESLIRAALRHACGRSPIRPGRPIAVTASATASDGERPRGRRGPRTPGAREQRRQADAAEHADDRRRGRHEAREPREVEQRHRGDERDPAQRAGGEHARRAPLARAEERQRPGDRERQRGRPPERLGRVAVPRCARSAPPPPLPSSSGASHSAGTRERRARRRAAARAAARARTTPRRATSSSQASGRTSAASAPSRAPPRTRPASAARTAPSTSATSSGSDMPPAACRAHIVTSSNEQRERRARRSAAAASRSAGGRPRRQAVGELGGEHERQQPRRAHEHEPQLRGGVAGERQRRGDAGPAAASTTVRSSCRGRDGPARGPRRATPTRRRPARRRRAATPQPARCRQQIDAEQAEGRHRRD